jgi:hypothetical protein
MMYFSERQHGARSAVREDFDAESWGGVVAALRQRINDGSFAYVFPEMCQDGKGPFGTNCIDLALAAKARVPSITWPLDPQEIPPATDVLDVLEFCFKCIAKPIRRGFHQFYEHYHLDFDPKTGRVIFREEVNEVFRRNDLAYHMGPDGQIVRVHSPVLQASLRAPFQTGDATLDDFLRRAVELFLDPAPTARTDALKVLWDAWERVRTLHAADKKQSMAILLEKVTHEEAFRTTLDSEAKELNRIGNSFAIRHSGTEQTPLESDCHVSYLFHRLFALLELLLRTA